MIDLQKGKIIKAADSKKTEKEPSKAEKEPKETLSSPIQEANEIPGGK